jgi:hypothetical protein
MAYYTGSDELHELSFVVAVLSSSRKESVHDPSILYQMMPCQFCDGLIKKNLVVQLYLQSIYVHTSLSPRGKWLVFAFYILYSVVVNGLSLFPDAYLDDERSINIAKLLTRTVNVVNAWST